MKKDEKQVIKITIVKCPNCGGRQMEYEPDELYGHHTVYCYGCGTYFYRIEWTVSE